MQWLPVHCFLHMTPAASWLDQRSVSCPSLAAKRLPTWAWGLSGRKVERALPRGDSMLAAAPSSPVMLP